MMLKRDRRENDLLPVPMEKRNKNQYHHTERPISDCYPVIDNDLARDNIENDIPVADLQDL